MVPVFVLLVGGSTAAQHLDQVVHQFCKQHCCAERHQELRDPKRQRHHPDCQVTKYVGFVNQIKRIEREIPC